MNNFEEYYNGFYKELSKLDEQGNTFSKIESFLPMLNGNETFLDIGCGHGSVSAELIKKGYTVSGIEINKDAIESLKQKGFEVYQKDISKPLDIDEKFDVVMILDVLEHLFDPYSLMKEASKVTKMGGVVIITVPLYFDIVDRFKILFTGSVISMDNLCYGEKNYKKFRSYNYDHIRFFRPKEIIEMGESLGLKIDKIEYGATSYAGNCKIFRYLVRLISNKYTINLNPNLLAHSMKIRWRVD
jgi:2-polyprenyl-3-methyl-5-hydroxy-6-metoxy-1,4-benzoquinol methylase